MKFSAAVLALLASATTLAQLEPERSRPEPIRGEEAIRKVANEVVVKRFDLELPAQEDDGSDFRDGPASELLWNTFANKSAERRFSGLVTPGGWEIWELFAKSLEAKARAEELGAEGLKRCLKELNQGRNRQTAWWPAISVESPFFVPGASPEEIAAIREKERQAETEIERIRKYRDDHIDEFIPDEGELAIVPVGAYLARHSSGECWIVVCKWEYGREDLSRNTEYEASLGHVMIWALDAETGRVLAYVSCD